MRTNILLFALIILLLFSCGQQTSNQSRQFENKTIVNVLTKSGDDIQIDIRYWYQFTSASDEPFDEKGRFINENPDIKPMLESTINAAVRTVIGKYSSKKLSLTEKRSIENEIYEEVKTFGTVKIYGLTTQFNEFLLGDIEYPHIINQAKNSDLLSEYDLLNSKNPKERLEAIEMLLGKGNETSLLIILEHWPSEKNQKNRDYILKKLSREE